MIRAALLCVAAPLLAAGVLLADGTPASGGRYAVLVLFGGRVVEGAVTQSASGYVVALPAGRLVIPFERVQVEAESRHAAWQKLHDKLHEQPTRIPAEHIRLAQWCLNNSLVDECRIELKTALELDPSNAQARQMLVRLDELTNPGRNKKKSVVVLGPDGFDIREVRSLGGLSRESAQEYVTKIQPILINGCGNARCHGVSSENSFRLENVRSGRGAHRPSTERNLTAVLQQLDRDVPHSPLLVYADKRHGGAAKSAFDGATGAAQRAALFDWAVRVTGELPDMFGAVQPTSSELSADGSKPQSAPADAPAASTGGDPLLERVLREEQPDLFDPEEFNRMVHGGESDN